jgi:hypothetical protein
VERFVTLLFSEFRFHSKGDIGSSAEGCGGSKRTTSSLKRRSLLRAMAKDSMLIMLNSVKEVSGNEAGLGADWTVLKKQILVHMTL